MSTGNNTKSSQLSGKTALITGAGRGIGRVVAVNMAAEGAEVVLTARTESQLMETANIIDEYGFAIHHAHSISVFNNPCFQCAGDPGGSPADTTSN